MVNKLLTAINEGINKALMNFDNDDRFKKNTATLLNFLKFHVGDYVYKDDKLGYNNYTGEKIAICVSDEPGKELYVVLGHQLLENCLKWANDGTRLYESQVPDFNDGYKNTQYILSNYDGQLSNTIWECLGPDEYIPTTDELMTIYENCDCTDLWDEIGLNTEYYWSSSLFIINGQYVNVICVDFDDGADSYGSKDDTSPAVVLLHIDI